jgi:hypothetical protein
MSLRGARCSGRNRRKGPGLSLEGWKEPCRLGKPIPLLAKLTARLLPNTRLDLIEFAGNSLIQTDKYGQTLSCRGNQSVLPPTSVPAPLLNIEIRKSHGKPRKNEGKIERNSIGTAIITASFFKYASAKSKNAAIASRNH